MKRLLKLVAAVLFAHNCIAQNVGIGTATPHASAKLEISSTTQGMLVPRMTTLQRNAISSPTAGLLVYDTDTNTFWYFIPGFGWSNLSMVSSGWQLTGNSGTDTAVNFIGTIDNRPLKFKVNNQRAGLIGVNGNVFWGAGSGSVSSTSDNIAIGRNSLIKNSYNETIAIGAFAMNNNTSGAENLAVGSHALEANINSGFNTAIGNYNLGLHTSGSANTAIGASVLGNHLRGSRNTAVGTNASFYDTTGNDNTALGYFGLFNNSNGNRNTALGTNALNINKTGSNNLGIGYKADALADNLQNASAIGALSRVDCNNCMVLGSVNGINGATSNVNVGIGNTNPQQPLSFPAAIGKKISLYPGASGDVGFGVYGNELRIHSDYSFADITFGYDDYTNGFTERMRIINNGEYGTILNGRMVLRNGTVPLDINYGGGIWLMKADNTSALGFMGTQNNQNMGFYGGPAGWGFVYDAVNSKVGIGNTVPSEKLQVTGNAKADNFIYTTPKTFYYNLSGSDFDAVRRSDTTAINIGSGGLYMETAIGGKSVIAPVHLPHGATMIKMTVYFTDASASRNLRAVFYRKTILSNFFPDNIGTVTSSGSSGVTTAYQTPVNGVVSLVDNSLYTYYISIDMEDTVSIWTSNTEVRAIVIEYTLSSAQ